MMKKRVLAVITTVILAIAMAAPVFAYDSPSTNNVYGPDGPIDPWEADERGREERERAAQAANAASGPVTTHSARTQDIAAREEKMIIPVEEGSIKTTLEESIDLAAGGAVEPVALSGGASIIAEAGDPAMISLAKTDISSNSDIVTALGRMRIGMTYGVAVPISAGKLSASDGRAIKSQTIRIDVNNLTSAKGVAILVYTFNAQGIRVPRIVKPNFSKGKLKVNLPVPCEYTVIQNKPFV